MSTQAPWWPAGFALRLIMLAAPLIGIAVPGPRPAEALAQQIYSLPFFDSFQTTQTFNNPPGHNGIDYVVGGAGPGERIVAAATGTARVCDFDGEAGYQILMQHWVGTEHRTRYLHLLAHGSHTPFDGAGVLRGQTVGLEGSTGISTAPHLHFETRHDATQFSCDTASIDGTPVDPNSVYTTNPPPYAAGRCYYPLDSTNAGRYPGVFRPMTNGTWWHESFDFNGTAERSFIFAEVCDIPVVGDWDRDGIETPGIFRPYGAAGAEWHISNNVDGSGSSMYVFGTNTDWPVAGDWNGDGYYSIGVWRPSNATWYLRNFNNTDFGAVPAFQFGTSSDKPVVGNWDADEDTNIGIFRADGSWWHLRESNDTGPWTIPPFQYGWWGDYPITGDWNWDGRDTIGIFRDGNGILAEWHLRNFNSAGDYSITPFGYGVSSDKPISGDWN